MAQRDEPRRTRRMEQDTDRRHANTLKTPMRPTAQDRISIVTRAAWLLPKTGRQATAALRDAQQLQASEVAACSELRWPSRITATSARKQTFLARRRARRQTNATSVALVASQALLREL